jgi:uncharacterized membrane protein
MDRHAAAKPLAFARGTGGDHQHRGRAQPGGRALRRNWSEAESFEQISIAGDKVTLLHKPWRGKPTSQHFNRRWLRVDLELDEARDLTGRLFLAYRGQRQEIGAFLGAEDRRSLAQALRRAIRST